MTTNTTTASPSRLARWSGQILSGLFGFLLLVDAAAKFAKPAPVVEGTIKLGYPESIIIPLGVVLTACTIIYLLPRTACLGAILLTGYLGGAVATHARVGDPLFSHTLFPIYIGLFLWLGLYLRNPRLRALIPLSR